MTTYQEILDSELDPGSPLSTSLMTRLARNFLAIAEGDVSAPGVELSALSRPTAGSENRYQDNDVHSKTGSGYQKVLSVTLGGRGSVRVKLEHQTNQAIYQSRARVLRNGNVIALWGTYSTAPVSRNVDISFTPGDLIQVDHDSDNGVGISYMTNIRLSTGGERLIPIATNSKWKLK